MSKVAVATVACAVGVGVVGCTMSGPSESASVSPSASASAVESEPAGDWQTVESDGVHLEAPSNWKVHLEDGVDHVLSTPKDDRGYRDGSGILMTGTSLATSQEELASAARDNATGDYSKLERLDDVKFGGTTFFHIRGTGEPQTYDYYGAYLGDVEVSVHWSFAVETPRKKIDAYIDQVMETFSYQS